MPIPCISWTWSPIPANPAYKSKIIAYRVSRSRTIAAKTHAKNRPRTRNHSVRRGPGSSVTAAGRSTWWAKNMPPTQTTAESVCRISDTDAIAVVSATARLVGTRRSMNLRLDLFAEQLQRTHHLPMRDLGAAIHLAQDAVETEGFLQAHQPVGDPLR